MLILKFAFFQLLYFKSNNKTFTIKQWKGSAPLMNFVPPVQAALSGVLRGSSDDHSQDHFSCLTPRMRAFSPQIQTMQSKARPKKITVFAIPPSSYTDNSCYPNNSNERSSRLQSSDVGEMHFLVKQEAKGDLRKDARVQDLNNVINRLLSNSKTGSYGRQRRLLLRTFSVICLSEDCGILEWVSTADCSFSIVMSNILISMQVPNTDSFRNIVTSSYNPQAHPDSIRRYGKRVADFGNVNLRNAYQRCQDFYIKHGDLTKAAKSFENDFIKEYPPVLYWWFVQHFEEPHAWFEARTNFALSAAIWSAVGHVIGLGDRHSENLLIDTSRGECVHVDFDCIFDKGLHLPRPEVIPFRLTPNMVDAFGPSGYEGTYRGGLTSAMKTLRDHRDTLLSVLEPFLKDPIIEWKRQRSSSRTRAKEGKGDPTEAKRSIKVIDERLRGIYNLRNPNKLKIKRIDRPHDESEDEMSHILPLSVEGQVHRMINEATSYENLVQLYVGWMPWI